MLTLLEKCLLRKEENSVNKADLVKAVSDKSMLTKTAAEKVLNAVLDSIREAIEKGESVRLAGFGSFDVVAAAPRTGRNPATGERIEIPARLRVRFTPSRSLRETVDR